MSEPVELCQDCFEECLRPGIHRVVDSDFEGEWRYCDEHVPDRDPGVRRADPYPEFHDSNHYDIDTPRPTKGR